MARCNVLNNIKDASILERRRWVAIDLLGKLYIPITNAASGE